MPPTNRGNYTEIGTPTGSNLPQNPKAGAVFKGAGGVTFVYRTEGPKGAGWYKKPARTETTPPGPTPPIVINPPGAPPFETGGTTPSGTTPPVVTPPVVTPPVVTPPAATGSSTPSYDYSAGYAADPRYATGLANIAANQVGIGNEYGLVINRDTNPSSPTYGMAMFRVPGQKPGTGNITAKIDPVTGKSVYSDATGKVYPVTDLELDVRELKPGEPGYLKGSIGNAAAQSKNQQYNLANSAAQSGAKRSGMRGAVSTMEVSALQGALTKLGLGFGAAFRGTTDQYANLLNAIFPDQADKAAALASAPGTGTDTGTGTGTSPVTPPVDPYKDLPSNTEAPESMPVPDRAAYTEKGTPNGSGLPDKPKAGDVFKGSGGVTWVYRTGGPDGAGWYKKPAATGGGGTGTGGAGGTGGGAGTGADPYGSLPSNSSAPDLMPPTNRGNYTEKGTPTGSNLPKNPKAGVVFKGAGGVTFVYRTDGPSGKGWYKKGAAAGTGGAGTGAGGGTTTGGAGTGGAGGGAGTGGGTGGAGGAPPPPVVNTPWWDTIPPNSTNGDVIPSASRGGFTVKGAPTGSNKPKNPVGGTVFKGAGGVLFVYRENGPDGAGWYKRP